MESAHPARAAAHGRSPTWLGLAVVATTVATALTGCENLQLPGSATISEIPPPVATAPARVAPKPPPPRPRAPGTASMRFREMGATPAIGAAALPLPPPRPPAAPAIPVVAGNAAPASQPAAPDAAPPGDKAASEPATSEPIASESVASELARSDAAAPAAGSPPPADAAAAEESRTGPPAPPPIEPASTVGTTATALRERFGMPERQTPVGSGATWHYEREGCRARFVLLPELTSGVLRVFSHEITPPDDAHVGPAACLGRIAAARTDRTAGTAP